MRVSITLNFISPEDNLSGCTYKYVLAHSGVHLVDFLGLSAQQRPQCALIYLTHCGNIIIEIL